MRKNLKDLASALDKSVDKTTKELGQKSLEYMQKQYTENNLSGHIRNIKLRSIRHRYKHGFTVSAGDDYVAIFNEFGTGIVGDGTSVLADSFHYKYNVPSPVKGKVPKGAIVWYAKTHGITQKEARAELKKITTSNTWWYWKNAKNGYPAGWRHTEGMPAKNMYASLLAELLDNAKDTYSAGIGEALGSISVEAKK